MDLGRLRGTDWVVGALGLALFGSLFLDWYAPRSGDGPALDAWAAFGVTDVVLSAFAVMAVAIVPLTATQRSAAIPVAWTSLTALLAVVALGFALAAALGVPGERLAREAGPAVGLALTVALAAAVWASMRNEVPGPSLYRSGRNKPETLPTPQP
jgi:hypothetical protein